ncbi:hypothetical protein NS44R_14845, partial [Mammaliicoccus sciuri]
MDSGLDAARRPGMTMERTIAPTRRASPHVIQPSALPANIAHATFSARRRLLQVDLSAPDFGGPMSDYVIEEGLPYPLGAHW